MLAQRLVRTVHAPCAGQGCAECLDTGFKGRTGVFELLVLEDSIRRLVTARTSSADVIKARAVATISLRQAFPSNGQLERFWGASAQIAALSGWLAEELPNRRVRTHDAYTYGLFRDCGIAMLLRRFPGYRQTLERANADGVLTFTAVEQRELPTDHAMVGCLLAQDWWLPEEICLAIRHHHDQSAIDLFDSGLPAASRYLVAISQTAEHLVQQLTGGSRTQEWHKLGGSCLRLLKLGETDLRDLHEGAKEVLRTVD